MVALLSCPAGALALPANQSCPQAAPLTFPSQTLLSTLGTATATTTTRCGVDDTQALWFRFVAPAPGRYQFQTAPAAGLSDTTLAFYPDCLSPSSACVDDTLESLYASHYLDLQAGEVVLVRAAGWGGTRGDFRLIVDHPEALARPSNDACADALPLELGLVRPTSTLFATGTDSSSCGSDDSSDLWYTFTASRAADYEFYITQNQLSATLLSVQSACGSGELACGLARAETPLAAGQRVYLRVGTSPNAADTFNVGVRTLPLPRPLPPPPNDRYDQAIAITSPGSYPGTTLGATDDGLNYGASCGPFVNAAVWYSFIAPTAGVYVFDTNTSAMMDTALGVFGPCLAGGSIPPQLITCDDNSGQGQHSRVEGQLMAGESICLAVAGHYLSERGDFVLNASLQPTAPPNDRCESAAALGYPSQVRAENFGARPEPGYFPCSSGEFGLWWSFVAPEDGTYKFDTKDTVEAQPELALFSSCDGQPVACSDIPRPAVSARLARGQRIYVRASSNVFVRGEVVLRVGPVRLAEVPDAGPAAGLPDSGAPLDAEEAELPPLDASAVDVGSAPDAGGRADAGLAAVDAASPDAGVVPEASGCGCGAVPPAAGCWWALALGVGRLGRRRAERCPPSDADRARSGTEAGWAEDRP